LPDLSEESHPPSRRARDDYHRWEANEAAIKCYNREHGNAIVIRQVK
jgi:hypothetical protein